ncbi:serine O-acetyltransferase EpsC [Aestuariivirga litoralis]|uniref:serine O-acetyltransferase EpsC n=1 Tax=Aestuariivirga litoralis TaxID=2650924 RepID=UPI0018C7C870|nr:serine O-acetyltransferase EpsC [Aestuariivirga litoralis]MBG1232577.1 serine acetyltransferase [Aestuariivirga litoralis]
MSAIVKSFPVRNPEYDWRKNDLVSQLRLSREVTHNIRHQGQVRELPSREALQFVLHKLCCALFPTHFGQAVFANESTDLYVGSCLQDGLAALVVQVQRSLQFDLTESASASNRQVRAEAIVDGFANNLPEIRNTLVDDFRAAYVGDPAAENVAEVVLAYRGSIAIIHHRIAHALYQRGVRLVARLIADIALERTGIDIHPGASIGAGFFIDHGSGVVIGQTAIIGRNVRLYQGVTLGAKSFKPSADGSLIKGEARHPIVEDHVVIYAGATILGRVTIGENAVIGGNAWVTRDVAPGSVVTLSQS